MVEDDLQPLVSVVIPFVGNVDWLREAVESVLAQTLESWELIIVSDEPLSTTTHLARLDQRISVLPGNATGPAANRNAGIRAAKGEYVAFLDADDLFLAEKLECQLDRMRAQSASFSHTSYEQIGVDGTRITYVRSGQFSGDVYPKIFLQCPIATPTVVVRRDLLLENLFREELHIGQGEDTLQWIALARVATLVGIDTPLSRVRIHGANTALNSEFELAAWRNIARLALPEDTALPARSRRSIESDVFWMIAFLERRRGRRGAAGRAALRAFVLRPSSLWARIPGVRAKQRVLATASRLRARSRRAKRERRPDDV